MGAGSNRQHPTNSGTVRLFNGHVEDRFYAPCPTERHYFQQPVDSPGRAAWASAPLPWMLVLDTNDVADIDAHPCRLGQQALQQRLLHGYVPGQDPEV